MDIAKNINTNPHKYKWHIIYIYTYNHTHTHNGLYYVWNYVVIFSYARKFRICNEIFI